MIPAKKRNRPLLELLMRFGAQVPAMSKWGRFYYFVHDDIAAFLEKSSAERWAQANHGNLLTYAEARKFVGGERIAQAR